MKKLLYWCGVFIFAICSGGVAQKAFASKTCTARYIVGNSVTGFFDLGEMKGTGKRAKCLTAAQNNCSKAQSIVDSAGSCGSNTVSIDTEVEDRRNSKDGSCTLTKACGGGGGGGGTGGGGDPCQYFGQGFTVVQECPPISVSRHHGIGSMSNIPRHLDGLRCGKKTTLALKGDITVYFKEASTCGSFRKDYALAASIECPVCVGTDHFVRFGQPRWWLEDQQCKGKVQAEFDRLALQKYDETKPLAIAEIKTKVTPSATTCDKALCTLKGDKTVDGGQAGDIIQPLTLSCTTTKVFGKCSTGYWEETEKCVKQACPANSLPGLSAWKNIGSANGGDYLTDDKAGARFFLPRPFTTQYTWVTPGAGRSGATRR